MNVQVVQLLSKVQMEEHSQLQLRLVRTVAFSLI